MYLREPGWIDIPSSEGSNEIRPDGGKVYTYILTKEGNYGLLSWTYHPWHISPCGPLWVVDSSSE
jgi:hypothetical protein